MTGYNGWSNRETWCANLWLSNDYGAYKYLQEMAQNMAETPARFANFIHDFFNDCPEQWKDDVGDMYAVNWQEIAENWLED